MNFKRILLLLMFFMVVFMAVGCKKNEEKKPTEKPADTEEPVPNEEPTVVPNEKTETGGEEVKTIELKDDETLNYVFNNVYTNGETLDSSNGFNSVSDLSYAKVFRNGEYVTEFNNFSSRHDIKMELYSESKMRFVNLANGYTFTLPSNEVEIDYSIGKYRIQMAFDDSILSVSFESSNPYTSLSTPWYTYGSEWLMEHIMNDDFIRNNGLERTLEMNYKFSASNPYGDLEFKDGYDCYFFGIKIKDPKENIERPYYNIAIVRQKNDPKNFILFVMKSKEEKSNVMNDIVTSYNRITSKGTARNYFYSEKATPNPNWDSETKAFFDKLLNEEYVNWGVFSYSMPGDNAGLHPGQVNYDNVLNNSKYVQNLIETAWNHKYEIYPTYTHLVHDFPVDMARELAGGNGLDGKPVLQFTYQFTTNNNLVDQQLTPMFDILRGNYDNQFHQLAKDIKEYGKPVLFRLNNEMNTDWTSYCGMMTLLDPDIFNMTWQRLYDICEEEGCTNLIWIWNPISRSCPYSCWGEDLCYFPGLNYVQLLGGTSYEFNNYNERTAAAEIQSFKLLYEELFTKNCKSFSTDWKLIISEFACGSGGAYSGREGRNANVQAEWVANMFKEMNSDKPADYIKQIRGAVWFNCNDYVGNVISNRLQLVAKPSSGEKYDDLADTMEAFRQGFADQDERIGK